MEVSGLGLYAIGSSRGGLQVWMTSARETQLATQHYQTSSGKTGDRQTAKTKSEPITGSLFFLPRETNGMFRILRRFRLYHELFIRSSMARRGKT
jgi:hypothetical protein